MNVKRLGLKLKRNARKRNWIGKQIIKDVYSNAPQAAPMEFVHIITEEEYPKKLADALEKAIAVMPGNFYLEITFSRDKLNKKAFRFVPSQPRLTPTVPLCDKHLYYYDSKECKIECIWHIPSKTVCKFPHLLPLGIENSDKVIDTVQKFNSGMYKELYKKLSGITED